MPESDPEKIKREMLLEKLTKKYSRPSSVNSLFVHWRKKMFWWLIIGGAKLIKRLFDVVLSFILLIALFPVFVLIALVIKFYDGGPVFYVANRVGLWGKEFSFPKFRTMEVDADKKVPELKKKSRLSREYNF